MMQEIPKRYIVALMCFAGVFNAYCMRVNVSVTIVAMVNHPKPSSGSNYSYTTECPTTTQEELRTEESFKGERYNWDSKTQGYILSAFFYGYFVTMLPGGYIAKRLGSVRVFGYCIFSTVVLTLLTPVVVRWGALPFIALRFLVGLGEGPTFPALVAIISNWSPKLERSRMTSLIFSGMSLGTVFSFTISGLISSSEFLGGWSSVFYGFGTIGCVWFLLWKIFIYETPSCHTTISKKELLKFSDLQANTVESLKIPWKSIFTSVPFWAGVASNVGHTFDHNIMITQIPTYLYSILRFSTDLSGVLTSLPHIAEALGGFLSPFITDKLISIEILNVTIIRKIFNSIGGYSPSICLFVVAFSGCHAAFIMFILCIGMFLSGFKYSGYTAGLIDMSPNFSGVLVGLSNGMGNIAASVAPTMVGTIISKGSTVSNWSHVFLITAAVHALATTIYAAFASAKIQPWN